MGKLQNKSYRNLLHTNTSSFWIMDLVLQLGLNFLAKLKDVFVTDIIQCYESIPLKGEENLSDILAFIIFHGFCHAAILHPKATNMIWIKISPNGILSLAWWNTRPLRSRTWFSMLQEWLIKLHLWLMNNYFVILGDKYGSKSKASAWDSLAPCYGTIYTS